MTLEGDLALLRQLEDATDDIGRELGRLAGDLARAGLEAAGTATPTTRQPIADQLRAIQRRHAELRAKLWTYAEIHRKAAL